MPPRDLQGTATPADPAWNEGHIERIRTRLRAARAELRVLLVALRHPRTPWHAKALAVLVVAYAVSPIDLVPDPIPVVGLLDDAILLPLGVLLVRRCIPTDVLEECRAKPPTDTPRWLRWTGAALVACTWFACVAALLLAWRS